MPYGTRKGKVLCLFFKLYHYQLLTYLDKPDSPQTAEQPARNGDPCICVHVTVNGAMKVIVNRECPVHGKILTEAEAGNSQSECNCGLHCCPVKS